MVLCPLGAVNQIFAGCGVNALSGLQRAILRPPLISNYTISTGSWHVQVGKKTKTGQPNISLIDQSGYLQGNQLVTAQPHTRAHHVRTAADMPQSPRQQSQHCPADHRQKYRSGPAALSRGLRPDTAR